MTNTQDEVEANSERGQAMVLAMVFMVVAVLAAMTLAAMATRNGAQIAHTRVSGQLVSAARAGLASGKNALWDQFVNGAPAGNKAAYRAWITANVTSNLDGTTTVFLDSAGSWQATAQTTLTLGGGTELKVGGAIDVAVSAIRVDEGDSTFVYLSSTATQLGGESRVSETVVRIGGAPWKGFDYALLANNVNCVFCHADIDNVTRFYPGMGETEFDRVKVATLEALQMRVGQSTSRIAGTLYASGALQDKHGNQLATMPSGAGDIQSIPIDTNTGTIQNTGWSTMENLVDSMGAGVANGNFYQGYDSSNTFDGEIPESFPPVIPDGDDRLVSDSEWGTKVTSLTNGRLTGGTIKKYADTAGSYTATGNDQLARTGGLGTIDSNQDENLREHLVLVGTKADPIRIEDDVAVNGDVMISGYIEGEGLLLARGNVYIVGDLIYNDGDTVGDGSGDRTFGTNGGSDNAWAVAAGGNIIHNNYNQDMQDRQVDGNNTETNGSTGGFGVVEAGLFNRMEWARSQEYVAANPTGNGSGDSGSLGGEKFPTLTSNAANAVTYTAADDSAGRIPTGSSIGDPVTNNAYQAGYIPRYYSMQTAADGGKIWIFNGASANSNGMDGAYWDNAANNGAGQWKGREFSRYDYTNGAGAKLLNALNTGSMTEGVDFVNSAWNPRNDWFDQDDLFKMYMAEDDRRWAANGSQSQAFEIDGLLYTNNSIFMMSRGHNNWTQGSEVRSGGGKMIVNGAIVAADLAMLVAGQDNNSYSRGLRLNYDERTSQYLTIEDTTSVTLSTLSRRER